MLSIYAGWMLLGVASAGALYAVAAAFLAGRQFTGDCPLTRTPALPVTVLRPLHGAEPGLFNALASSLRQDYAGEVQLVCGIQADGDPANAIVAQLKAKFPDRDIVAVVAPQQYGCNAKISNLLNTMPRAKHDILVLADSDIILPPDWLSSVIACLNKPGVGAVSCFYAGEGQGGWARWAAMGINYQFLPNALFGTATALAHPCMGSTIAVRRQTLAQIGGFEAFRDTFADDFEIGRAVRGMGLKLAYPPLLVSHSCTERNFRDLWAHELRWARTIRTIDAPGHWGSAVTYGLPWGLLGAAILGFPLSSLAVLATVLAARLFLKVRMDHIAGKTAGPVWLLPVRDLLSFAVFVASLFGDAVEWKGRRLRIGRHGAIS